MSKKKKEEQSGGNTHTRVANALKTEIRERVALRRLVWRNGVNTAFLDPPSDSATSA